MSFYLHLFSRSFLAGLVASVVVLGSAVSAGDVDFGGTVRDSLGRAIEDAEVWFLKSPTTPPLAQLTSDHEGRFRLSGLGAGRYRIGAAKVGYRLFIADIDTLIQKTVDVVLHPASEIDVAAAGIPADPAWVLRAPRRSMWRETDAGWTEDDERLSAIESFEVRIDQSFSADPGGHLSSTLSEAGLRATETRAFLTAPITDEGAIQARVERFAQRAADAAGERFETERVSLDFAAHHSPSAMDRLEWTALHSDRRSVVVEPQSSFAADDRERTLALGAHWDRALDAETAIQVDLDWTRAEVGSKQSRTDSPGEAGQKVLNDRWRARGTYAVAAPDRHRPSLSVGLAGEARSTADIGVDPGASPVRLELEAGDRVSTVRGLDVEFGARWVAGAGDRQIVEPGLGAGWSAGAVRVHARLSYVHDLASGAQPDDDASGRVGYEASIVLPLGQDWKLSAETRLDPLAFDLDQGGRLDPSSLHPLYVVRGGTHERESLASLSGDLGWGRVWIEGRARRVQGSVIPLLPFAGSVTGASGEMRVATGRAGLSVATSGTGVELAWVRSESESSGGSDGAAHSTIDVRLTQALGGGRQARSDWRLLLAYQNANSRSDLLDSWTVAGGAVTRDALEHRLSAGVSVVY